MDHPSNHNNSTFLDPESLADFIDALRSDAFPISPSRFAEAMSLAVHTGRQDDVRSQLRSALCSSESEGEAFDTLYQDAAWKARLFPFAPHADATQDGPATSFQEELNAISGRLRRNNFIALFLGALLLAGMVFFFLSKQPQEAGTLHLETADGQPAIATLSLADSFSVPALRDTLPLVLGNVPSGSLHVDLRWPDVVGHVQTAIQVEPGDNDDLLPFERPDALPITLNVSPADARVSLGKHPVTAETQILPGTYALLVERAGYESHESLFTVSAGSTARIDVALTPLATQPIIFQTSLPNVSVQIGGEARGITDEAGLLPDTLYTGTHTLTLEARLPFSDYPFASLDTTLTIPTDLNTVFFRVPFKLGALHVTSEELESVVYLDGDSLGITGPRGLSKPNIQAGVHTVRIELPDAEQYITTESFVPSSIKRIHASEQNHTCNQRDVAFHPEGKRLGLGSPCAIQIWQLSELKKPVADRGPADTLLLGDALDSINQAWQDENVEHPDAWLFPIFQKGNTSPDAHVATMNPDGAIEITRPPSTEILNYFTEHDTLVTRIQYSKDGRLMASADVDGHVYLHTIKPTTLATFTNHHHQEEIYSLIGVEETETLRYHQIDDWYLWSDIIVAKPSSEAASSSEASTATSQNFVQGSETFFWTQDEDHALTLANNINDITKTFTGHNGPITSVAMSPGASANFAGVSAYIASGSADHTIRIWRLNDTQHLVTLNPRANAVRSVAFHESGKLLVAQYTDGTVYVFDIHQAAQLGSHDSPVSAMQFSEDGKRLATAGTNGSLYIWDTKSHGFVDTLRQDIPFSAVAFNQDGSQMAATLTNRSVVLWSSGSRLQTILTFLKNWWPFLALLVGLVGLIPINKAMRRRTARAYLAKHGEVKKPRLEYIRLAGAEDVLFDDFSITDLAGKLKQSADGNETAGLLALIDSAAESDHQAQIFDNFLGQLKDEGVPISRYIFDHDPRVSFRREFTRENERPDDGIYVPLQSVTLKTLAEQYPNHRLLFFADASTLLMGSSGQTKEWIGQLERWQHCTLITPKPRTHWSRGESILHQYFQVVFSSAHATEFKLLGEDSSNVVLGRDLADRRLPDLFTLEPEKWLRDIPPTPAALDELLDNLRAYLDEAGLFWLNACAVYPQVEWNLTLNLGRSLRSAKNEPLFHSDRLAQLARLPWFRDSYMPEWLRERLINEMSGRQKRQVRTLLRTLLLKALRGDSKTEEVGLESINAGTVGAISRPVMAELGQPRRHPLEDELFAEFLSRKKAIRRVAIGITAVVLFLLIAGSTQWNNIPIGQLGKGNMAQQMEDQVIHRLPDELYEAGITIPDIENELVIGELSCQGPLQIVAGTPGTWEAVLTPVAAGPASYSWEINNTAVASNFSRTSIDSTFDSEGEALISVFARNSTGTLEAHCPITITGDEPLPLPQPFAEMLTINTCAEGEYYTPGNTCVLCGEGRQLASTVSDIDNSDNACRDDGTSEIGLNPIAILGKVAPACSNPIEVDGNWICRQCPSNYEPNPDQPDPDHPQACRLIQ